jgi:hypothetical protein
MDRKLLAAVLMVAILGPAGKASGTDLPRKPVYNTGARPSTAGPASISAKTSDMAGVGMVVRIRVKMAQRKKLA